MTHLFVCPRCGSFSLGAFFPTGHALATDETNRGPRNPNTSPFQVSTQTGKKKTRMTCFLPAWVCMYLRVFVDTCPTEFDPRQCRRIKTRSDAAGCVGAFTDVTKCLVKRPARYCTWIFLERDARNLINGNGKRRTKHRRPEWENVRLFASRSQLLLSGMAAVGHAVASTWEYRPTPSGHGGRGELADESIILYRQKQKLLEHLC